jgi:hypothetical protein
MAPRHPFGMKTTAQDPFTTVVTAEVPFDLVEAKLTGPAARSGTVAKADAIARYGKTTLLA